MSETAINRAQLTKKEQFWYDHVQHAQGSNQGSVNNSVSDRFHIRNDSCDMATLFRTLG